LKEFLEYVPKLSENQDGAVPDKAEAEIAFDHISFTYHGAKEPTLKDISFTIHRKEKIAVVGHNGAGKTTLIKLLMRLYDPDEGTIRYNGIDIREYNVKKYRSLFGSAFQDYQVFAMTVAENVLMRSPQNEQDYERVKDALTRSYVYDKVCSLPNGMDTVLTREFDENGAVLSGGEYQKIAVARAYAKDFEIAVFDEPSSALDPIAEYQLYESIRNVCKDKTVIFISHRLSSAVLADRIYLFDNGSIIEEGSHQALMEKNGVYADMFRKQAKQYQEEEE
jgi:ATP-binding cassette subfamily B protein